MLREVVQEIQLQKVQIRFVDKMLCNIWLHLHFIFINSTTFYSDRLIVPSGVTLPLRLIVQSKLHFEASKTIFVDSVAPNGLKTSFWRWKPSRHSPRYSIVAFVWYQYCAMRWQYTWFLTHNRAAVNEKLWLTERFKRVSVKTGTIMLPSAFNTILLHYVTWLHGLLNQEKPGYGGIISQTWLNNQILECCSRKDITQSIKYWRILRLMVKMILGTIIVIGEMHFILEQMPAEVPTAWYSRPCLASVPPCHLPGWRISSSRCIPNSLTIATIMNSLIYMTM